MLRFDAITANSYINPCSYDRLPFETVMRRISYEFFSLLVNHGLATGLVFILAFIFSTKSAGWFQLRTSCDLLILSAVILLLSANFMTVSWRSWSPMCLDPRHYLFLVPVASVPAARIIRAMFENRTTGISVLLVLLPVTVISAVIPGESYTTPYLPLLILFLVFFFCLIGGIKGPFLPLLWFLFYRFSL
ncbi:MAG: hypothetical protein Kow00127_03070 [Bacteroidales bacterium]